MQMTNARYNRSAGFHDGMEVDIADRMITSSFLPDEQ